MSPADRFQLKIPAIFVTQSYFMRRLIFLFITVIFVSCGGDNSNTFSINGEARGYADGTNIMVYDVVNNQPQVRDTLVVQSGQFAGTLPNEDQTTLKLLKVQGSNNNIVFFAENEDLKAHVYKDSLGSSYVTGGKQNELYRAYNDAVKKINDRKQEVAQQYRQAQQEQDGIMVSELRQENALLVQQEQDYKRQFISENNNSLFSIMLLQELFTKEEISAAQAQEIIDGLSPKMAAHPSVAALKTTMQTKKKASIGGLAPDFTAPDPNGEMLSLSDAMGKYTIIDFWASWCRPCRRENPNVVRVYNKYHDKGLNIISVSLDKSGQQARWIKAIEDDQMDWYHVSNLKFWQDPIAKQYNVRSIPATFLLDQEGRIIDKNLRGKALENRIAGLLD